MKKQIKFIFCFVLIFISSFLFLACNNNVSNKIYFAHLSFDDVQISFNNLDNNNYSSLFEEPFFKYLKKLHTNYNVKVSLYTYNDTLKNVSDKYVNDFYNARDWLKIGLHSSHENTSLENLAYNDAKNLWQDFVNNVFKITNTFDSVDRFPRLHGYRASTEAIQGFLDASPINIVGLLTADDLRLSYNLSSQECNKLNQNDAIKSSQGLIMLKTDIRFEMFKETYNSTYNYTKPIFHSVYKELNYRSRNYKFSNQMNFLVTFTHEWDIYEKIKDYCYDYYIEDFCKFNKDNSVNFDFPQNQIDLIKQICNL